MTTSNFGTGDQRGHDHWMTRQSSSYAGGCQIGCQLPRWSWFNCVVVVEFVSNRGSSFVVSRSMAEQNARVLSPRGRSRASLARSTGCLKLSLNCLENCLNQSAYHTYCLYGFLAHRKMMKSFAGAVFVRGLAERQLLRNFWNYFTFEKNFYLYQTRYFADWSTIECTYYDSSDRLRRISSRGESAKITGWS